MFLENFETPKKGRKPKVPPEMKEYERILERLRDATEVLGGRTDGYRESLEALKQQYQSGKISSDEFEQGMDRIKDRFEENRRAAERMRDQVKNTFADMITGARSVEDARASRLSNWAGMLANSAFSGLLGSIGGDLFSDIGNLLSFDGGGFTGSGPRSGGGDGRGGFPAILHPGETVIDHTKGAGGAAPASPSAMNINVHVSGARGNAEITEMVRTGVSQGLEQYDRVQLPRRVGQIRNDPRRVK